MKREPGRRWKDWVNWVALTGGLLLGGLVANLINGTFFPAAGFAVQLAVWSVVLLACGLAAVLVTALRLNRLDLDR